MQMRIGGKGAESTGGRWIEVRNPADGTVVDRVPAGTADDVAHAVEAAGGVAQDWAGKTMRERGMILFRAAQLVREQHHDLARLLTTEQGKPVREATDEVRGFANILEFYAAISGEPEGDAIHLGPIGDAMVMRVPLGICGAIIPWNMPVIIMGWKVGPALVTGNTLVLKPASTAPLTDLKLAEILETAGLPPGVLNVVTGSGEEAGEALVRHPEVRKISFTGDYRTGHRVREVAGGQLKQVTLELGGSDPMIVMDDADIGKAVEGALRGRFYNAGQTCTAVKRLFVHEKIAETFQSELKARVAALRVGNGLEKTTEMGPLNSRSQRDRIISAVGTVKEKEGGKILTGGETLAYSGSDAGNFYLPTLVSDVPPDSCLLTEEIFGPVLPVVAVPDLDTAIQEANRSRFGLGASVWTRDMTSAKRVYREVKAGIVWVNRHLTVPPELPFGGVAESGIGRENGKDALREYSQAKTLLLGW